MNFYFEIFFVYIKKKGKEGNPNLLFFFFTIFLFIVRIIEKKKILKFNY